MPSTNDADETRVTTAPAAQTCCNCARQAVPGGRAVVDRAGRFFCALDCAWSRTIADEEAGEHQRRAERARVRAQARQHREMQARAETTARRARAARAAKAAKAQRAAARAADVVSCLRKGDERKGSADGKKNKCVRFSIPSAEAAHGARVDLDKSDVYHAMFQLDALFDFGPEGGGGGELRL